MTASLIDDGSVIGPERAVEGSYNLKPAVYPKAETPTTTDYDAALAPLVEQLSSALSKKDFATVANLFVDNGYWRDHLASSWEFRTVRGKDSIKKFLDENGSGAPENITIDRGSDFQRPHFGPLDGVGDPQGITAIISFKSKLGSGRGCIRALDEGGVWKIWTLFFTLESLSDAAAEPAGPDRPQGVEHGAHNDRRNWQARRKDGMNLKDIDPTVLIVGAGQAGLMLSARLKMQGIEALAIDLNDRIGDNWRKRYDQLVLHDPVWYDHFPYLPFPKHWPVFTPKDKLAEWFESYTKVMEINVWTKTKLLSSKWDDNKNEWTVELERTKDDGTVERRTFHPRHVVQATGHSGKKAMPRIKGMEDFKGHRLCHSSEHPGAQSGSKGRKAVVVGACNSSHDICHDFYEQGYDVTMVQRTSTCVVSSYAITHIALKSLYDESGPDTEDADIWLWGLPIEVFKAQQARVAAIQRDHDAKLLDGLQKAGFLLDNGPNGGGLFSKYYQRGGGYYIDVGASQLIIDGKIKVKQGQAIAEVLPNGLKFADGSVLEADEIVFATGYENMRTQSRAIFGDEVADRVGDFWGYDEEGEWRMQGRRSGHPGFWMIGGNLAINRYHSRLLALQIKAIETGMANREPGKVKA